MHVSAIYTYPVKGCRRIEHDSAVVEPWGLAGDRRWLITDLDGTAVTQRDVAALALLRAEPQAQGLTLAYPGLEPLAVPAMEGEASAFGNVFGTKVAATPAPEVASRWLSEALQREVRLVWLDDPTRRQIDERYANPGQTVSFADGFPLLLTNNASMRQLNEWIGEPPALPMTRFRPNIVIDSEVPFVEDEWTGLSIHIGGLEFHVPKPCGRCVVTTTDQETGERGKEPLKTLGKYRNVNRKLLFGTNLVPVTTGVVRVGDEVTPAPAT